MQCGTTTFAGSTTLSLSVRGTESGGSVTFHVAASIQRHHRVSRLPYARIALLPPDTFRLGQAGEIPDLGCDSAAAGTCTPNLSEFVKAQRGPGISPEEAVEAGVTVKWTALTERRNLCRTFTRLLLHWHPGMTMRRGETILRTARKSNRPTKRKQD